MSVKYVLALDQGTTSCRAILFDQAGQIAAMEQKEFKQIFPHSGWVEHDAEEIWETQQEVMNQVLDGHGITYGQVDSIGITNQRETSVVWNKHTGKPIYNAIVWQDKRTANICEEIKSAGHETLISERTGLVVDSYFSGTKVKWILDHVDGSRKDAEKGDLLFGTIDTWLVWKLTNGEQHVTEYTNASRTMMFNINDLKWDQEILSILDVPETLLPSVQKSSGEFGIANLNGVEVPITGIAGDQQAALFGQACTQSGLAKNTYGTGCFMLMNTGDQPKFSKNGLLTTLCCGPNGEVNYALEGSIFIAGAAVQWLRDGLELVNSAEETEALAQQADPASEIYLVPAFVGLGAPYWDMYSRGTIFGLTRDSGKKEMAKATLEAIAYQVKDVLIAMEQDAGVKLKTLRVDGGACANNYLMQFQSDILETNVERPEIIESTALGAAYLAGLATGFWSSDEISNKNKIETNFTPQRFHEEVEKKYSNWKKAISRTLEWLKD